MAAEAGRGRRASLLNRVVAALTLLMAPVVLGPASAGPVHGYSLLVMSTVALGAIASGVGVWRSGDLLALLAAGALAALVLVGEVVVSTFGSPTGPPWTLGHWTPAAALLVALATLVLTVVVVALRTRSQNPAASPGRPYAL